MNVKKTQPGLNCDKHKHPKMKKKGAIKVHRILKVAEISDCC